MARDEKRQGPEEQGRDASHRARPFKRALKVTVLEDEFRMAVTRHRGSVGDVILTGSSTRATPGQNHWAESPTQTSLCLMRSRSACGSSLR
jgi:hypothetical protein